MYLFGFHVAWFCVSSLVGSINPNLLRHQGQPEADRLLLDWSLGLHANTRAGPGASLRSS